MLPSGRLALCRMQSATGLHERVCVSGGQVRPVLSRDGAFVLRRLHMLPHGCTDITWAIVSLCPLAVRLWIVQEVTAHSLQRALMPFWASCSSGKAGLTCSDTMKVARFNFMVRHICRCSQQDVTAEGTQNIPRDLQFAKG